MRSENLADDIVELVCVLGEDRGRPTPPVFPDQAETIQLPLSHGPLAKVPLPLPRPDAEVSEARKKFDVKQAQVLRTLPKGEAPGARPTAKFALASVAYAIAKGDERAISPFANGVAISGIFGNPKNQ